MVGALCLLVALFVQVSPLHAQSAATNQVLDLDGNGSYVELPPNIFNTFDEATVETWVKFRSYGIQSRVFEYGRPGASMMISQALEQGRPNDLKFVINPGSQYILIPNILVSNRWYHLAAVSGIGGMKFFINGELVWVRQTVVSFSAVGNGEQNNLGKSTKPEHTTLNGQMDEFRVWRMARAQDEIKGDMFRRLTGNEPGLAGLWNFETVQNGQIKDATTNHHDGKFVGNAKVVAAELPAPADATRELITPTVIFGMVVDETGKALPNANVVLEQAGVTLARVAADRDGSYRLGLYPQAEPYDFSANSGAQGIWLVDLKLNPGEQRRLDLKLKTAISISGSVLAPDRSPQAGVVVQAVRVRSTVNAPLADTGGARKEVVNTTISEKSGHFQFVNLRPGSYQLRCQTQRGFLFPEGAPLVMSDPETATPIVTFRVPPVKKGSIKAFTALDGLADNWVWGLERETDGSIWCATDGGVSRFDGKEFTSFTVADGLAGDVVHDVHRDPDGTLWFATSQGVSRFDHKRFDSFTVKDGLVNNDVWCVVLGPDGKHWFGTVRGISSYDGKTFTSYTSSTASGLPSASGLAFTIAISPSGTVWLGSQDGLVRFDGINFINVIKEAGLPQLQVFKPVAANDGTIWFGSRRGLWRYDGTNFVNRTQADGLVNDYVSDVFLAPDHSLWLGTGGGASRYDGTNFLNFTQEDGLPGNFVSKTFVDAAGTMWFATSGGLARYDGRTFISYNAADGLPANAIRSSFVARDGSIWFSTRQDARGFHGISRFDG